MANSPSVPDRPPMKTTRSQDRMFSISRPMRPLPVYTSMSYPSYGEWYLMQCSSKFRAGEMPTTIPPADFAPFTASCGRPGQAPVTRTQPRAAMIRPISVAILAAASLIWPPADPMTPTVILRRRRSFSPMAFPKRSSSSARGSSASLAPLGLSGRRAPGPPREPVRPFDPSPPCAYTDRPLQAGPHILRDSVNRMAQRRPPGPVLPKGAALALCAAVFLLRCGGSQGPSPALDQHEGLTHPMAG